MSYPIPEYPDYPAISVPASGNTLFNVCSGGRYSSASETETTCYMLLPRGCEEGNYSSLRNKLKDKWEGKIINLIYMVTYIPDYI